MRASQTLGVSESICSSPLLQLGTQVIPPTEQVSSKPTGPDADGGEGGYR